MEADKINVTLTMLTNTAVIDSGLQQPKQIVAKKYPKSR